MKSDPRTAGRPLFFLRCLVAVLLSVVPIAVTVGQTATGEATAGETRGVLLSLAKKAIGEEAAGAEAIVDRLLAGAPVAMDATFREEVEASSAVEAARIFGLTLLRSGEAEFYDEGIALLEKAVAGESVLAMEVLAQIHLEGAFGQEQDVDEAVELLKQARLLPGATEAHRLLGDLALAGTGLPKDPVLAIEYYRRGAEAGAVSCLLALHRLFREKDSDFRDVVEAERYGRAAAEAGDSEAMMEMAAFFEGHTDDAPEWLRAAEWLRKAVEGGSSAAGLRLADYHFEGRLGAVDGVEGMRLLRLAAAGGSGEACFRIGEAYKSGKHLPQDPVASTAWFRVGAELGSGASENAYGLAVATGYGTRADPVRAVTSFERAAGKGQLEAFVNLGELHEHGVGVERDLTKAAGFYRQAAEAGVAIAQGKLAELLSSDEARSLGDPLEAAYWAARSVASGRGESKDLADRLRNSLSPELQGQLKEKLDGGTTP